MARVSFALAVVLASLAGSASSYAQPAPPPSAAAVLGQAKADAAASHTRILLVFGASWCGPCHLFQGFLDDPAIRPIMSKAFTIAHLDVEEHAGDKRHIDSPGGEALKVSLGGERSGIPFIAALDADGKPIVTSLRPAPNGKENIGYPDLPVEIDWFMTMLDRAAPNLTAEEKATVRHWLQAHGHAS